MDRAALWDAWEQVAGCTTEEIRQLCRVAREAHGLRADEAAVVAMALVLAGGGSWTGDEVPAGACNARDRATMDYETAREKIRVDKPVREQIRRTVAAAAAGKTRQQVREELFTAYDGAGLEYLSGAAPAEAVKIVGLTWREKLLAVRDFRAFRETALGLPEYSRFSVDTTARPRRVGVPAPEWSQPPPGSTAPARGATVAVRVELTDDGVEALARLVAEWQPDAPDHQPICWLTAGGGPDDPVVVHLGDRGVGRLDAHGSDLCREEVAAADAAGHWQRGTALLTGDGSQHSFLLRLRIPLRAPRGDPE